MAVPIYEEAELVKSIQPKDSNNIGRQGILEIPKQVATIIREALTERLERFLSTTTTTTASPIPIGNDDNKDKPTTTKVRQPAQESNAIEVTTKKVPNTKQPDTFLEEFLSNNFLSNFGTGEDDEEPKDIKAITSIASAAAPVPNTSNNNNKLPIAGLQPLAKYKVKSTVEPKVVTSTVSLPTSSFSVVANAFPSDFDDGVSLVGIISTPGPSTVPASVASSGRLTTPNPPLVVTTDEQESEVTTTEQLEVEEETTTEETTTADPEEEDEDETTTPQTASSSSTTDPDEEEEGDVEV